VCCSFVPLSIVNILIKFQVTPASSSHRLFPGIWSLLSRLPACIPEILRRGSAFLQAPEVQVWCGTGSPPVRHRFWQWLGVRVLLFYSKAAGEPLPPPPAYMPIWSLCNSQRLADLPLPSPVWGRCEHCLLPVHHEGAGWVK
jgi:hypothetical protein